MSKPYNGGSKYLIYTERLLNFFGLTRLGFQGNTQSLYDEIKQKEKRISKLNANLIAPTERVKALEVSILEYQKQNEDLEDKLLQVNCKMSKSMLSVEKDILRQNKIYYNNMSDNLTTFTIAQNISIDIHNKENIESLFIDYSIAEIVIYLKTIHTYGYHDSVIPLIYLYLHKQALDKEKDEESIFLNHWTIKQQAEKIKNLKCEGI